MILEGDFLRHWKTRYMAALLENDPLTPVYILAIWLHLYDRRTDALRARPDVVVAVAGYEGPKSPEDFMAALEESELFHREGDRLVAHGFKERHARSFANWENGILGGRKPRERLEEEDCGGFAADKAPKKKPKPNPTGTQREPNGNPKQETEDRCPHKELQEGWNQIAAKYNLRICHIWPADKARARWKTAWFRESWRGIFEAVGRNKWCRENHIGVEHALRPENARRYYEEMQEKKQGRPKTYTAAVHIPDGGIILRDFPNEAEAVRILTGEGCKRDSLEPQKFIAPTKAKPTPAGSTRKREGQSRPESCGPLGKRRRRSSLTTPARSRPRKGRWTASASR